jgi:hypothetical protein
VAAVTTAAINAMVLPHAGTIRNLYVRHNAAGGTGPVVNYFVLINGVVSALTVTLATGAVGQASNTVNILAVNAGDRIELQAVKPAAIGGGDIDVQVTVEYR